MPGHPHFTLFQPHTQYKHQILQFYLERWVRKVLAGRPGVRRVVMVDAFAGAGRDLAGNSGSPIRMGTVAVQAEGQLRRILGFAVRVEVVLIEKDDSTREALRECMATFGDRIEILGDTLATHLDTILARYGDAPMLFFLDPFGVIELDAALITRAVSGPGREMFMLVDDDGADRLVKLATAPVARRVRRLEAEARQLDLLEDNDVRRQRLHGEAAASQRQLKLTGQAVSGRLTQALGSEESWTRIAALPTADQRRDAVVDQFERLLVLANAPFTTRIPVRSSSRRLEYVLLHASRVAQGRSTMKTKVERAQRRCALPPEVVDLMRQDLPFDLAAVVDQVIARYSGREAAWPANKPDSIREFILQHTNAFPWHLDAIEERLEALGYRLQGRAKRFSFPSVDQRAS